MKRFLFAVLLLAAFVLSPPVHAQQALNFNHQNFNPQAASENIIQEMQKNDPQAAQEFSNAIRRGDFQTAKQIYQEYKQSQSAALSQPNMRTRPTGTAGESIIERTLSGKELPLDMFKADLMQFGYDTFMRTAATFVPPASVPVGPDYLIGPGDHFTLTLWGTTEGIYALHVSKEGNITLPKVGVVSVAGLRFGELEKTIRRNLSRYYSNFNLSVAMGSLKTITVYVVGEVENPGSYALPSLSTVYSALFAAGGPTRKGTLRTIKVLRAGKVIKTIDLYDFLLKGDRSQDIRLRQEDTIFVPLIGKVAGVSGAVYRPAIYELKGKETIRDVLNTAGGIMPISLASRVQLTRYADNTKKVILDIRVQDPPGKPGRDDLGQQVENMDVVRVLPIYDKVWETVSLTGDVRNPGEFQWSKDLKLKQIIQEGQLLPTADLTKGEIVRLSDDFRDRYIIPFKLDELMKGDESQNITLHPQDEVRVFTLYRDVEKVTVSGEVMSAATGTVAGEYEIHKGERLSDLLKRLGGFTPEAYPYGTVFKRKDVKKTEDKNLQAFIAKMQSNILQTAAGASATAISTEEAAFTQEELKLNKGLLDNMKTVQKENEGRVAINITDNIDEWAGTKDDLLLKDGDSIFIPKKPQEVLVMGEVHSPSAQIFIKGNRVKDYIDQTGGFTDAAAESQVYVLQANGFAFSSESPSVGNIEKVKLNPGDTIFVPTKTERHAAMRTTKDIVDIMFKTAVVIATISVLF